MLTQNRAIKGMVLALAMALSISGMAPSASAQSCGPMDVVFIIDETGSMTNVINEIQTQVQLIANEVENASGGDYQFGMLGMPDNNIRTLLNMSPNNRAALDTAVQDLSVAGGCGGVPYDEAFNTALNFLSERTGSEGAQLDPFTGSWRPGATKIIILVTDTYPQAFTCQFEAGVHDVAVHDFAEAALAQNIRIATVFVDTGNPDPDAIKAIMEDASVTSGGLFREAEPDASDLAEIIVDIIKLCGGAGTGGVTSVFVEPTELVMTNGQTSNVRAINFQIGTNEFPVRWSANSPEGITATFSPRTPVDEGTEEQTIAVTVGPDTPQGTHLLAVRTSRDNGPDQYAIVHVIVECRAPFFLGTPGNQPQSQTVNRGSTARLRVVPGGDGPFRYQWYRGHSGQTTFPIAGATGAELVTDAVNDRGYYWVRVSNACGSRDSATATVSPSN